MKENKNLKVSPLKKSPKNSLRNLKENVLLKEYTTFRIGGPARYFVESKSKEELVEAIKWAGEHCLPFFILGEGSNVLAPDKGYKGLVINYQLSIINYQKNRIVAGGGTKLKDIVKASAERGLSGLEWAAGIPGTIGGAIFGNAAAFGRSMANLVERVEVLDAKPFVGTWHRPPGTGDVPKTKKVPKNWAAAVRELKNKDCQFREKDSIFKKNKNLIILSAVLKLRPGNKREIKERIKKNLACRKKHPQQPSAGCVFKNPPHFSAGRLIEQCGLKGKTMGRAQIAPEHANFIVNLGGAKGSDVKKLIKLAKQKVKEKFGLVLKEEIQIF